MASLSSIPAPHVALDQIWPRLSADYQARAIRLMAQLAYNFVAAHPTSPLPEVSHASPAPLPQDPP